MKLSETLQTFQVQDSQKTGASTMEQVLFEVKRMIVGQDYVLERLLVALLARGHILLEGVPGLAKTMMIRALAEVVGGTFGRVQFTPDLMPADLIGTRIFNVKTGEFAIETGPIFANLLLADEINRTPPKVQSALLEAMQERQVTIGKQTFPLPDPFMFKVLVDYPSFEDEIVVIQRVTGPKIVLREMIAPQHLLSMQDAAANIYVDPGIMAYAARLVDATRYPAKHGLEPLARAIRYGGSPRASINLIAGARALAFLRGREYVLPQDVASLVPDVLRHRLVISYEGLSTGVTPEMVIEALLQRYPPPKMDMTEKPNK
jgi:MoxR-like ATPase